MKSKQSAVSISAPNHLRLGEYCKAFGGVFAGLVRGAPGKPDYYLFVAHGPKGEHEKLAYGGYGHEVKKATSDNDGAANTAALCAHTEAHPAAQWARDLKLDGFSDFYLPSRNELRICYANAADAFAKEWYWSSTQYAGGHNSAWHQYFGYGNQDYDYKDFEGRCRAVRRLIIL